jgi:hypothetical protein
MTSLQGSAVYFLKRLGKVRINKHMVTVSNSGIGIVWRPPEKKLNRYKVGWATDVQGKQGKTSLSIFKHGKKNAFSRGQLHPA